MPFVKLDTGILDSTLWIDRTAREVFITALLMAEPYELTAPVDQYNIESLELSGWQVPAGWYGLVKAAAVGIVHRAKVSEADGFDALKRLGSPEPGSRSPDYGGRRLVRIEGGFIVLNFQKYRDRDYTAADRARRYRERKSTRDGRDDTRDITQAEAEAEANKKGDMFGGVQPRRKGKKRPEVSLPDGFVLDSELRTYVLQQIPDCDVERWFEDYCLMAQTKQWRFADWRLAVMTSARNSKADSGHFLAGRYPKKGGAGPVADLFRGAANG